MSHASSGAPNGFNPAAGGSAVHENQCTQRLLAAIPRTVGIDIIQAGGVQVHRGDEGDQLSLGRARRGVVVHIAVQQVDVKVLLAHASAAHILRGTENTQQATTPHVSCLSHVVSNWGAGQGGRQSESERAYKNAKGIKESCRNQQTTSTLPPARTCVQASSSAAQATVLVV